MESKGFYVRSSASTDRPRYEMYITSAAVYGYGCESCLQSFALRFFSPPNNLFHLAMCEAPYNNVSASDAAAPPPILICLDFTLLFYSRERYVILRTGGSERVCVDRTK